MRVAKIRSNNLRISPSSGSDASPGTGGRTEGDFLQIDTDRRRMFMKITITAVSVPALRQIQAFRKRYEQQYPEDDLNIVCFYVAGQEQRYVLEPKKIINAIATADVAVVDTMGASEEFQEIVAKGLKACKGHRIVIGNALRDYIRLGSFSMGPWEK